MEQKLASKERYLAQEAKALEMLHADSLYNFIDGLRYAYSFSIRYKGATLLKLIDKAQCIGNHYTSQCFECGILKPWKDTLWFDKEKAESLQQYILEHNEHSNLKTEAQLQALNAK